MGIRETIAQMIAPGLKSEAEIRASMAEEISRAVAEQIARARMDMPATAYRNREDKGYRRLSDDIHARDLEPMQQARMFAICYYMFDASAMFRRLAKIDRGFLFSGPVTCVSADKNVQRVIDRFITDPENNLARKFPDRAMWLSLLGEACWPVEVNPINGAVRLLYADPAEIKDVWVNPLNVEQRMQVEMMGRAGRPGLKYAVIRRDYNARSRTYNRLVGNCFFYTINAPPNASRGRSDFLTLVDWIDSLERYGYNYLERAELMLNFIWDITLKGMNGEQIREWLRDNPVPTPGSQRAHNENVEWNAVSPDLKATDFKSGFDMGKAFVMGAAGRPESWFGSGGKQYQTEADQSGQAPVVDLEERQGLLKDIYCELISFAIDQAVIAGVLSPAAAEAGFTVEMPEVSKKDLVKFAGILPQFTTALAIAMGNKLIQRDTAIGLFSFVARHLGYEVDAQAEIDAANTAPDEEATDYAMLLQKLKEGDDGDE